MISSKEVWLTIFNIHCCQGIAQQNKLSSYILPFITLDLFMYVPSQLPGQHKQNLLLFSDGS